MNAIDMALDTVARFSHLPMPEVCLLPAGVIKRRIKIMAYHTAEKYFPGSRN